MIYITQLIFIKENKEEVFHQFEELAIPLISKYKGELLFRIRPQDSCYIGNASEKPYEIHLVKFNNQSDFEDFMKDDERKNFLHLKEESIRSALLIKGNQL